MPFRTEGPDYFEATVLYASDVWKINARVMLSIILICGIIAGVGCLTSWYALPVFLVFFAWGIAGILEYHREMAKQGLVKERFVFDRGQFCFDGPRGKWSFDTTELRSIEVSTWSTIRFETPYGWHKLEVAASLDREAMPPLCRFLQERFPDRYKEWRLLSQD